MKSMKCLTESRRARRQVNVPSLCVPYRPPPVSPSFFIPIMSTSSSFSSSLLLPTPRYSPFPSLCPCSLSPPLFLALSPFPSPPFACLMPTAGRRPWGGASSLVHVCEPNQQLHRRGERKFPAPMS
eukprot:746275-Hanusia_phi.AAC.2